jgi:hypothetical protein
MRSATKEVSDSIKNLSEKAENVNCSPDLSSDRKSTLNTFYCQFSSS